MTSFVLSSVSNVTQTLAATEVGVITASGVLVNPANDDTGVYVGNATLINHGTIALVANSAVFLFSDGAVIENSGTIQGEGGGIIGEFSADGHSATVINRGTISSDLHWAFQMYNGGNSFTNYGEVSTNANQAVYISDVAGGNALGSTVTNFGRISSSGSWGIDIQVAGNDLVRNLGEIVGGVRLLNGDDRLINGGDIVGNVILQGTNMRLNNTGTVAGDVTFGAGINVLINSGLITGDINGSTGSVGYFDLRGGTVTGLVLGSTGSDTYLVDSQDIVIIDYETGYDTVSAWVNFTVPFGIEELYLGGDAVRGTGNASANFIYGNDVDNVLTGADGGDTLGGNVGADVLRGGLGFDSLMGDGDDDTLLGENDNDTLNGGSGLDALFGGQGVDSLLGGLGEDTLTGGAGNDVLRGEGEDDVLIGGRGRDTLVGGADADVFVWNRVNESGVTASTRDVINDFVAGLDRIDLSGMEANILAPGQAFGFIETAAFGGFAGQLRYFVSGANIILEGDVDGNSVADFQIQINGVASILVRDIDL